MLCRGNGSGGCVQCVTTLCPFCSDTFARGRARLNNPPVALHMDRQWEEKGEREGEREMEREGRRKKGLVGWKKGGRGKEREGERRRGRESGGREEREGVVEFHFISRNKW